MRSTRCSRTSSSRAGRWSGFDAPYVPGWDCHGLPIELNVEKKVGKAGAKVDASTFRKACRDYAGKQVDGQRKDFIRLGVFGDWNNPYLTMDYRFEADIIRALGRIIDNGHLHKGFKPVHWCTDCQSALAEAEVEYEDKDSPAIDVRFRVLNEAGLMAACHHVDGHAGEGPVSVVIWTTTPWTLPANLAVALNPELDYAVVQCDTGKGKERLVIAEALLKDAMLRYGAEHYQVVAYGKGSDLEGLSLAHPFYAREVPVILGDHVTTEAGTGAVHTAPGHGQDDYVVGSRYRLEVDNPVGGNGCFLPDTELFAGEHVFAANAHVIEVLKSKGALLHEEILRHSYPHCWRHKTPIIFRATPQWFISMEQGGLRETALAAIDQVRWLPDWGKARIEGMVAGRPDWCISRQRTWGVPITLFVHKQSGELHPDTARLIERVAQRVEQAGIDAWFELEPADLLGDDAADYDKVSDTLDVWFDSGVTHFAVLERRAELAVPADLYLEGSDQHRGWFQSSLLTSIAMRGSAPYRTVLTHGFTVDAKGQKMSKSRGNVVAPQKVMNSLGADILRLWVAATDYRGEMTVSDEILKRTADAYRRLRNTSRFLLANLNGFDPAAAPARSRADAVPRPLGHRAHAQAAGAGAAGLRELRVPPHLPAGAQLLCDRHGQLLSRYHQGPPVHHAGRQHTAPLGADRPVSRGRGAGALAGADPEFHRRGNLAAPAGQACGVRVPVHLVRIAAGVLSRGRDPAAHGHGFLGTHHRRARHHQQGTGKTARGGRHRFVAGCRG